jgi:hypothetical protein
MTQEKEHLTDAEKRFYHKEELEESRRERLTDPQVAKLRQLGSSSMGFTVPAAQLKANGIKRPPYLFTITVEKDRDGNRYIILKQARSNPPEITHDR